MSPLVQDGDQPLGLLGLGRSAGRRTKGEASSGGGACELAYGILRWMIEFDMRTDQQGRWPPARIASACRSLMAFRSAQWPAWSPGDDTGRNERCVSQRRRLRTDCPARAIRGRHCRAKSLRTLIVELDSNGRPYSQLRHDESTRAKIKAAELNRSPANFRLGRRPQRHGSDPGHGHHVLLARGASPAAPTYVHCGTSVLSRI
jgi:hypothetical protein